MPNKPVVYCISEGIAEESNFIRAKQEIVARIRNAARCGVTLFQIREKRLTAARLFDLSHEAAEAARFSGIGLLVNDRLDVALAAGAGGVHLPGNGLPVAEVRRRLPENFIIGVSAHSPAEAVAAKEGGADLVVFGPVFESPGKGRGVGLERLAAVCEQLSPLPVAAVGGINKDRIEDVLKHGAAGFAAIRYLNECLASGTQVPV